MPASAPRSPRTWAGSLFDRANAGDLEGLVALYEPGGVLASATGQPAAGHDAIRAALRQFLAGRPVLTGESQPARAAATWP